MTQPTVRTRVVEANDLEFGIIEAGSGPLALCLHGFPDCAHTWRHLLPALAEAGFHAVAPFMRGYAPTGIPADGADQVRPLAGSPRTCQSPRSVSRSRSASLASSKLAASRLP